MGTPPQMYKTMRATRASLLCCGLLVLISASLARPGNPPNWDDFARMARYVVHYSDWAGIATISTRDPIKDYPFSNVKNLADGSTPSVATGMPYFYISPMDLSSIDLEVNPQASLSFTLADGYCRTQTWIAQDPRCPRLLVTGKIVTVEDEDEKAFAKDALFTRFPIMDFWPENHGFFFAKLVPESILLLDQFGGAADISPEEYFAVDTPEEKKIEELFSRLKLETSREAELSLGLSCLGRGRHPIGGIDDVITAGELNSGSGEAGQRPSYYRGDRCWQNVDFTLVLVAPGRGHHAIEEIDGDRIV